MSLWHQWDGVSFSRESHYAVQLPTALSAIQGDAADSCEMAAATADRYLGVERMSHILASEIRSAAKEIQFRSLLAVGHDSQALDTTQKVLFSSIYSSYNDARISVNKMQCWELQPIVMPSLVHLKPIVYTWSQHPAHGQKIQE